MLVIVEDMPGNILVIKASGEVTSEDYESVINNMGQTTVSKCQIYFHLCYFDIVTDAII